MNFKNSILFVVVPGAIAGIVDQPMQNFQRNWEMQSTAGSRAKGVISGVGKGIVGVFTKPIGGAAELVSQTGYGAFIVDLTDVCFRQMRSVFFVVVFCHGVSQSYKTLPLWMVSHES